VAGYSGGLANLDMLAFYAVKSGWLAGWLAILEVQLAANIVHDIWLAMMDFLSDCLC